jgi:hypothetical protein
MKKNLFALALIITSSLAFGQAGSTSTPANGSPQATTPRDHARITGCLSPKIHDYYELTDQNGVTNMVYSSTMPLDSYVGHSVTLVGSQSATPSTDTGTARPMPHFNVLEVRPASGNCK